MFSDKDRKQFEAKGISIEQINEQLENFRNGFPPAQLVAPATPKSGILKLNETEINELVDAYEQNLGNKKVLKFVPASGAASRMFKNLMQFYHASDAEKTEILAKDQSFNSAWYFFRHLKNFAFYEQLKTLCEQNEVNLDSALEKGEYNPVLKYFLTPAGLDYANLPKALLHFHTYDKNIRTSIEEHIAEAAAYACSKDGIARLHFTLSPEHIEKVKQLLDSVIPDYEKKYQTKFEISFSVQESSTDTIAVDLDNQPFRDSDGNILFRPGGHGALIHNLNKLNADLIFIKNIDNVVPDSLKAETIRFKKLIGSKLLEIQNQVFEYARMLDENDLYEDTIEEVKSFFEDELMFQFPDGFDLWEDAEKLDYYYEKLNRPIRVCGMVKNEGEPGGGPFWVENGDGSVSLQIVESSQINLDDPKQAEIFKGATHFNPVDLVCSRTNFKGEPLNLDEFIDPETGFISEKSSDGKDLKALELPGLWNGAMANWITLFVEVPLITFNPVKYINDLLREQHQ